MTADESDNIFTVNALRFWEGQKFICGKAHTEKLWIQQYIFSLQYANILFMVVVSFS